MTVAAGPGSDPSRSFLPWALEAWRGVSGAGHTPGARRRRQGSVGRVAADADRKKRFEQEARAASALNHPNIVTIHDIGTQGDDVYIAMEFVDGRTMREVLGAGALPTRRLLDLQLQLATALPRRTRPGSSTGTSSPKT